MNSFWETVWDVFAVAGWSVAWRIILVSVVGTLTGLILLGLSYRLVYKKNLLALSWRHERFYRRTVMVLWALLIPTLTIVSGSLLGVWWAGSHLIAEERLGERVGKETFQVMVAGMTASSLEKSEQQQIRLARALLEGTQKLEITELSKYTSANLAKLSAERLQTAMSIRSESFQGRTAWAIHWALDAVAYAQLGSQGDAVYLLVNKVTEHDRATDDDGFVTVHEVSDIACETFLDKIVKTVWAALVLEVLMLVAVILILVMALPVLFAWSVRKIVARRALRRALRRAVEMT